MQCPSFTTEAGATKTTGSYSHMPLEQLRTALQALAAPAEQQLARYPSFAVVADELALDFDDALGLLEAQSAPLTKAQMAGLLALDALLNQMSGSERADLWTSHALRSAAEWEEVRSASIEVLELFGWSPEPPPPSWDTFIPGTVA